MTVAVVRYNAGNVRSVTNALERIGAPYTVTDDPTELRKAERVIFPGVGEARAAMSHLTSTGLDVVLKELSQPVLGICLGMQLLCASSDEGDTRCLGLISERVRRFSDGPKVPHMGWGKVFQFDHPIFSGIPDGEFFYFVHTYRVDVCDATVAECGYGGQFSAAIARGNFVGVQFHPEKSAQAGESVLKNFMEWRV